MCSAILRDAMDRAASKSWSLLESKIICVRKADILELLGNGEEGEMCSSEDAEHAVCSLSNGDAEQLQFRQ